MLAPIILFVYNRPKHTLATLQALVANDLANDSVIYIYADGPKENASEVDLKKIEDTRQVIRNCHGFKKVHIIESVSNNGLANSVINGVTQIIHQYSKVIVLEDDLITAKGFLKYMNDALLKYNDSEKVMQISGHQFPVEKWERNNEAFFLPFTTSWGWATWKRAWDLFDLDAVGFEKLQFDQELQYRFNLNGSFSYSSMLEAQMINKTIDSWAIRWWWTVFNYNGVVLFPDFPLVLNIGFGVDSTHTATLPYLESDFSIRYSITIFPEEINSDKVKFNLICDYLRNKKINKKKNKSFKNLIFKLIKSI